MYTVCDGMVGTFEVCDPAGVHISCSIKESHARMIADALNESAQLRAENVILKEHVADYIDMMEAEGIGGPELDAARAALGKGE